MKTGSRRLRVAALLVLSLPAFIWGYFDYRAWYNLGAGGVPHNVVGWAMVTAVRPLKIDPHTLSGFEQAIGQGSDVTTLQGLPRREGERPNIAPHPIPHRQLTQVGSDATLSALVSAVDGIVRQQPGLIEFKTSRFETHNDAVWLSEPQKGNPDTLSGGEVAHVHPSDGSMHVILSPSDAKLVMEAGWGELHPIAGYGPLAPTYLMLYSPRDAADIAVIRRIIEAAVFYATNPTVSGNAIQTNHR